ncbi:hypothetical protein MKX07_003526 [Trichoderma sp. CBMAI-0711]|nr:hypothetical protein MKX07_003526 [Trichoderma sp. CBMAI-0711]
MASLGAVRMFWESRGTATIRGAETDIARVICPERARVKALTGSRAEPVVALHESLLAIANCLSGCNGRED